MPEYRLHKDPTINAQVNSDVNNLEMALELAATTCKRLADEKRAVPALMMMLDATKRDMGAQIQHMLFHHPEKWSVLEVTDIVMKNFMAQIYYTGFEMGRVGRELTEHDPID